MDKVLVIAPHADDAEFGMGGYLHRMHREGLAKATVAVMACGDYVDRFGAEVSGETRMLETARAMEALGVGRHANLDAAPENGFDRVGQWALIGAVDQALGMDDFAEAFFCLPSCNQDHRALYQAAAAAFRPGRWPGVKRVWLYEHPGQSMGTEQPVLGRCYVRFGPEDMHAKARALNHHESQFLGRQKGHDSPEGAFALARLRGSEAGAEFAELLWLFREVY